MTMVEKILAKKSGKERVSPGDIVVCDVDMAVLLDLGFSMPGRSDLIPKHVHDTDQVAVILDHTVPAPTTHDAEGHKKARSFVREFGIDNFFDVGNHGICHQVIMENGLASPGGILACSDSHTIASGAMNCLARGLGPVEILQIVCTGQTWYKVTPTIRYELVGALRPGVYGKDVFLHIAGRYGSAEGYSLEFGGDGVGSLSIDDRSTLATMCAEVSAEFALFPYDDRLENYLSGRRSGTPDPVHPDPNADYAEVRSIDLSAIAPHVSNPDHVPGNTRPVDDFSASLGEVSIDQAFVGSCANGKLSDIRVVAEVLTGRRVHPDVRFIVTPASQRIYREATRLGYVETILDAGAVFTNSTCGACYGGHMGVVGRGEVCITSSTRNFRGRMGSPEARIYLASSATVAASAVAGHITAPTTYLELETPA